MEVVGVLPEEGAGALTRISRAALFVKVTARMRQGATRCSCTSHAIRWVITRVLPLPGPARISAAPAGCSTAARCSGLSPSRDAATVSAEVTPQS